MERQEAIAALVQTVKTLSRHKPLDPVGKNLRGEALALHLLCKSPGLGLGELGRNLEVTPPRVAAILDRLEAKGLLVREPAQEDRRRTRVRITEAGMQQEQENRRLVQARTQQVLSVLETEEIETLARILGKLNACKEDNEC